MRDPVDRHVSGRSGSSRRRGNENGGRDERPMSGSSRGGERGGHFGRGGPDSGSDSKRDRSPRDIAAAGPQEGVTGEDI